MNLTQLKAFQAVMTSASLSDAARKLGKTQPAVSATIKSLEDRLGMQLFERHGRRLVAVPEARYLLAEAGTILSQMDRVRLTMRSLVEGASGSLNVAAMPGPVSMLFPRFIAGRIGHAPDYKVSIFARSSPQIEELARAQNIDFGFADAPATPAEEDLYRAEFITGDCFIALPAAHPLSRKPGIAIADLDGAPLGTLQPDHVHRRRLEDDFRARGARLNVTVESQTFLPIMQFVMAGQCAAIVDPLTVVHLKETGMADEPIALRPLSDPVAYRYAIVSPLYRPASILADRMRLAWREEVVRLLESISARPEVAGGDP